MAELQYKLMTSAVNNFDCGNPAINEYVENSYFATLLQQCYAYEIEYKSLVVGYYMITFRDVAFYDCSLVLPSLVRSSPSSWVGQVPT